MAGSSRTEMLGSTRSYCSRFGAFSQAKKTSTTGLPPGWERDYTTSGKVFYINHKIKETYWDLPDVVVKANENVSRLGKVAMPVDLEEKLDFEKILESAHKVSHPFSLQFHNCTQY